MRMTYSLKIDDAIDNLFADILANDVTKIDHYQARLDFLFEKLNERPELLGYRIYKPCIAQAIISYQSGNPQQALDYSNAAINYLGEHKMQIAYKNANEKILDYVKSYNRGIVRKNNVSVARSEFLTPLITSIGLFALGSIITGISYAITAPGGTYLVTSGVFIFAIVNSIIAVFRFFKWMAAIAKNK